MESDGEEADRHVVQERVACSVIKKTYPPLECNKYGNPVLECNKYGMKIA